MDVGTGNLYGGWCFVLRVVVPKVVRYMAEIRCVVGFRTNLQLIVLKILSVVSCEESGFVGFILLERKQNKKTSIPEKKKTPYYG